MTKKREKDARDNGSLHVTKTYKEKGQVVESDEESEEIEVRTFESEPAIVSTKLGITKNLGDYNSLRVDVNLSLPCYPEEKEEAKEHCVSWAKRTLVETVSDIQKKLQDVNV